MKTFIEEYGLITISIIVIGLLLGLAIYFTTNTSNDLTTGYSEIGITEAKETIDGLKSDWEASETSGKQEEEDLK